ncbi:MAG: hypothetical protein U0457_21750 [Candidatus Sericytochromatia bacterium]
MKKMNKIKTTLILLIFLIVLNQPSFGEEAKKEEKSHSFSIGYNFFGKGFNINYWQIKDESTSIILSKNIFQNNFGEANLSFDIANFNVWNINSNKIPNFTTYIDTKIYPFSHNNPFFLLTDIGTRFREYNIQSENPTISIISAFFNKKDHLKEILDSFYPFLSLGIGYTADINENISFDITLFNYMVLLPKIFVTSGNGSGYFIHESFIGFNTQIKLKL